MYADSIFLVRRVTIACRVPGLVIQLAVRSDVRNEGHHGVPSIARDTRRSVSASAIALARL